VRKIAIMLLSMLACLPAKALASQITCTVTGPTSVVIMESSDETTETGAATCMISGVPLPSSAAVIDLLENPSDPEFDSTKPVSDYLEIDPGGNIVLLSDFGGKGLPTRPGAIEEGPEPLGFGSVAFPIAGTTYTVFSDVAPEPSTLLLFGSGLLALFARRKTR